MSASTDFLHSVLSFLKRFGKNETLFRERKGLDRLGRLVFNSYREKLSCKNITVGNMDCALITPKDIFSSGIVIYFHGGGYVSGGIEYAKGFGATLAVKCGLPVFCPDYRVAPENIFPAAVEDAAEAYKYLLSSGYSASQIVLCGESAGGGLCYSLCHALKEKGWAMPAGIIAISPWTDLTCQSESYIQNKEIDPFIRSEQLEFYANCYLYGAEIEGKTVRPNNNPDTDGDVLLRSNPLVSPLFGDMTGFPPSVIFVGSDEILLDDSKKLHEALLETGCESNITVAKKKWHAYLLFALAEDEKDFDGIRRFIRAKVPGKKKLRWMSLDNAAKIFPAARRRNWSNVFRLSATLNEPIDREVLKSALDMTVRRFPSIAVRVKTGFFWYYLEEINQAPEIIDEKSYPLSKMPFDDIRKCAFRVIVYNNRIAAEFFHAVTDGNGALVFLKTLVAEYLTQKYGLEIPATDGILSRLEEPETEELEDSFMKHCGPHPASRKDSDSFRIIYKREPDGFRTNTTFIFDSEAVSVEAKKRGVTVTAFLSAALLTAANRIQKKTVRSPKKYRPVKVTVPVNLRKLFPSKTLRNFALYANVGFDPRLGEYSFDEVCGLLHHEMKLKITKKNMAAMIATNVGDEKPLLLRATPLFLKNIVMKIVFNAVGEKKACFSFSNLGIVNTPAAFSEHVERLDFVLGVQADAPYNASAITYKGRLYMNIIRNINEPILERELYGVFREIGLKVRAESNSRS